MSAKQDLARAQQCMDAYLADLQAIVNIDSGTYTPEGVNQVGAYLAGRFQGWGFATRVEKREGYGAHLPDMDGDHGGDGRGLLAIPSASVAFLVLAHGSPGCTWRSFEWLGFLSWSHGRGNKRSLRGSSQLRGRDGQNRGEDRGS